MSRVVGNICPCCRRPLEASTIMVSLDTNEAAFAGGLARLTPRQAELAFILAKESPRYVSRERILARFYGSGDTYNGGTKTVEIHVSHLRKKLASIGLVIENASGVGYRIMGMEAEQMGGGR